MFGQSLLHYRLEQELGSGAMGVVYKAFDTKLERHVALKFLRPELLAQPTVLARFQIEAKAISKLDHNNIGVVYSLEESPQGTFIVMAFYQGQTLAQFLQQPQDLKTIIALALELASGLNHAHSAGVVHRDIKPANIFVTQNQQIKILDFGLSKLTSSDATKLTEYGKAVGTPLYSSPEQLRSKTEANPLFDIWAFGCVLYEMLAGQSPFLGASLVETVANIISKDPKPLLEVRPSVPEALANLVQGCLQKDPSQRIQTAREIANTLKPLLLTLETNQESQPVPLMTQPDTTEFRVKPTLAFPKPKLPSAHSMFVGRTHELTQLKTIFLSPHNRLLSVVGLGGMGKTRLALEAAWQLQEHFRDGAAFVDLSKIEDPTLIPHTILQALDLKPNQDPKQDVLDALAYREMLLVLDNFEHLFSQRELLAHILAEAPKVKMLVTTRERLRLQAETVLTLDGFEVEDSTRIDHQAIGQIFVNSAKRANHGFELHNQDQATFSRIVQVLGGSPLGLELAAAWTPVLSLAEIAQELETGLSLLETDAADMPQRHRNFEAVFNSSWLKLSQIEQEVLAKLTVFRGGFNKEWAKKVVGANIQILDNFLTKSLVYKNANRFFVHELIRQLAGNKLSEKDLFEFIDNLARECDSLSAKITNENNTSQLYDVLKIIDLEIENIKIILDTNFDARNLEETKKKVYFNLSLYFFHRGLHFYGIKIGEKYLKISNKLEKIKIYISIINLHIDLGNIIEAESIINMCQNDFIKTQNFYYLGRISLFKGRIYKRKHEIQKSFIEIKKSIMYFKKVDKNYIYSPLIDLGDILQQKYPKKARMCYEIALKFYQKSKDNEKTAIILMNLSKMHAENLEFEISDRLDEELINLIKESKDINWEFNLANHAGVIFEYKKDYINAHLNYKNALKISFDIQNRYFAALHVFKIGKMCMLSGNFEVGIQLTEIGLALLSQFSGTPIVPPNWERDRRNWHEQSQFSQQKIDNLVSRGLSMSYVEAVNYAFQTY